MEKLVWFFVIFVLVYLFYFFFVIVRKKKLEKIKQSTEIVFLQKKFKLNLDKFNTKFLANVIALTNAFIIGVTFTIVEFFDSVIIKLMIAFVTLMVLILCVYYLLGKYLKKKEGK